MSQRQSRADTEDENVPKIVARTAEGQAARSNHPDADVLTAFCGALVAGTASEVRCWGTWLDAATAGTFSRWRSPTDGTEHCGDPPGSRQMAYLASAALGTGGGGSYCCWIVRSVAISRDLASSDGRLVRCAPGAGHRERGQRLRRNHRQRHRKRRRLRSRRLLKLSSGIDRTKSKPAPEADKEFDRLEQFAKLEPPARDQRLEPVVRQGNAAHSIAAARPLPPSQQWQLNVNREYE